MHKQPSCQEVGWQLVMAAQCPGPRLMAPGGELWDHHWTASLLVATQDHSKGAMGTSKLTFTENDCRCWHRWPFLLAVSAAPHGQGCPMYKLSWRWKELLSCYWPLQEIGMERRRVEKQNHLSCSGSRAVHAKAKGGGLRRQLLSRKSWAWDRDEDIR